MNQQLEDAQLQRNNQPSRRQESGGDGGDGGGRMNNNHHHHPPLQPCPRCNSTDTKFGYYNNYNSDQPRFFCKGCRRYWTHGGIIRNIPIGSGSRKRKRSKLLTTALASASDDSCSLSQSQPPLLCRLPRHQVSNDQPPPLPTNVVDIDNMLFGGLESGAGSGRAILETSDTRATENICAGTFMPTLASTVEGELSEPPTFVPNFEALQQIPQNQLSSSLFTVSEIGGPSCSVGEWNLSVQDIPPLLPPQVRENYNNNSNHEDND